MGLVIRTIMSNALKYTKPRGRINVEMNFEKSEEILILPPLFTTSTTTSTTQNTIHNISKNTQQNIQQNNISKTSPQIIIKEKDKKLTNNTTSSLLSIRKASNGLSGSRKFSSPSKNEKKVASGVTGGILTIKVTDSGCGIPAVCLYIY